MIGVFIPFLGLRERCIRQEQGVKVSTLSLQKCAPILRRHMSRDGRNQLRSQVHFWRLKGRGGLSQHQVCQPAMHILNTSVVGGLASPSLPLFVSSVTYLGTLHVVAFGTEVILAYREKLPLNMFPPTSKVMKWIKGLCRWEVCHIYLGANVTMGRMPRYLP